jgi:hypothetical protein
MIMGGRVIAAEMATHSIHVICVIAETPGPDRQVSRP